MSEPKIYTINNYIQTDILTYYMLQYILYVLYENKNKTVNKKKID